MSKGTNHSILYMWDMLIWLRFSLITLGDPFGFCSWGCSVSLLHAKFLPPEVPDATVAAESEKDKDPLQRVEDDEKVPEDLMVDAVAKATKDPREAHDARYLKCFRNKDKKFWWETIQRFGNFWDV